MPAAAAETCPLPAWRLAAVTGLMLALLAACGQQPQKALGQARDLLAQRQPDAAALVLKSLLQEQPDQAEARWLLGTSLLAQGQPAAAEAELRRAQALQWPLPQVAPALARAQLAQGHHQALLQAWQHTPLAQPAAQADLNTSLAQALLATGDGAGGRRLLAEALRRSPDFVPAQLLQTRLEAQAGQDDQAMRRVDAVLDVRPEVAEAWALKAALLARRGQATEAQALYRRALEADPALVQAHAALIGLQLAQPDTAAASASLAAMQKALPRHPQTQWLQGQVALARGELQQADAQFQQLLKAAPDNLLLLQSAATTALQLQRPAQADRLLARALQLAPDSAPVRRLQARTQLALGQAGRALETLAPLLAPSSADAQALALAAQANLLLDQRAAAQALFDRAAALNPADPRLRTLRALAQLGDAAGTGAVAGRQAERSLAELQAVAASDGGAAADVALITAHLQARRWDAALAAVDALARKQPGQPLAAMLRGQVLLAKADRVGARRAFEQALALDPLHLPAAAALGRMDLADRQPDRARSRFEAMLAAAPHSAAPRLALADLLQRSAAPAAEVAEVLRGAVKADTTDLGAHLALIDHLLARRDAPAALLAAQSAAAQAPDEPELLLRLGRSQLLSGEPRQAASSFSRLSAQQPRREAAWQGLIEAQLASRDLSGASASAKRAMAALPRSLEAQRLGIVVALRQQQPQEALAIAQRVQAQRPDEAVGHLLAGEVAIAQAQWPEALAALRQAVALREPGPAPVRLHQALLRSGDVAGAEAMARQWLKQHPGDVLFHHHLGDQAMARRDWPEAQRQFQRVLALQPEQGVALNNLAWALLQQRQPGALAFARRAVQALPGQASPLDTLGAALAAEGQLAPAIDAVVQALALAPGDAAVRLHLARLYVQADRRADAQNQLAAVLAKGAGGPLQAEARALADELAAR